jgi:hypothetical protein
MYIMPAFYIVNKVDRMFVITCVSVFLLIFLISVIPSVTTAILLITLPAFVTLFGMKYYDDCKEITIKKILAMITNINMIQINERFLIQYRKWIDDIKKMLTYFSTEEGKKSLTNFFNWYKLMILCETLIYIAFFVNFELSIKNKQFD